MMPFWKGSIFSAIALYSMVQCQTFQDTPVYNVVKNRPVSSSSGKCMTYCNSDVVPCVEENCDFTCPWGKINTVPRKNLLVGASQKIGCEVYHPSQGFSNKGIVNDYTYFNSSRRQLCVVPPTTVTTNGYFAVGFWIIANGISCATVDCYVPVLKIYHGTKELLAVKIGIGGFEVTLKGGSTVPVEANISTWNHLTVQFTNFTITIVKNGDIPSAKSQSEPNDPTNPLTVTVGATTKEFTEGAFAMSDLIVIGRAVGGRELLSLIGLHTKPRAGAECQCLVTHLLETERKCSRQDRVSERNRLNQRAHYLEYINDGLEETRWISPHQDTSTINFSLQDNFQILNMSLTFGTIPRDVSVQLLSSGNVISTKNTTLSSDSSSEITISWDVQGYSTDRSTYEKTVADNIRVTLIGHQKVAPWDYHSVSEVEVMGSLACFGSPVRKESIEPKYKCDCQDKSAGSSCNDCDPSNYLVDEFLCGSCNCNSTGSDNLKCTKMAGICTCKTMVVGTKCDLCADFHYSFTNSGCKPCDCDRTGSSRCDMSSGACLCKTGVDGATCDACKPGHFGFSESGCTACGCNTEGSTSTMCNVGNGQCRCNGNVTGRQCDKCEDGFMAFPGCKPCQCNPTGLAPGKTCNSDTGKCLCAGGVDSLRCNPTILSMTPSFGPVAGGTLVTVTGQLLGEGPGFIVNISDVVQINVARNHSLLVFKTIASSTKTDAQVTLSLSDDRTDKNIDLSQKFQYRPNPTVSSFSPTEAFASGGTPLTVKGDNLDSVYRPLLLVHSVDGSVQLDVPKEVCTSLSKTSLECPAPNLDNVSSDSEGSVRLGLVFDGLTTYTILPPETGNLTVFPNPTVNKWEKEMMEFTYPFNNPIEITGTNFTLAADQSDYRVLIGDLDCPITFFNGTVIRCEAPTSPSGRDSDTFDTKVTVGYFQSIVGTLKYVPFYKTAIFIGSVAGLGVLLLAIIVIIVLCKRRRRKSFDQTKPKKRKQVNEDYLVPKSENTDITDGSGTKYTGLVPPPPPPSVAPVNRVKPVPKTPSPSSPSTSPGNTGPPLPAKINTNAPNIPLPSLPTTGGKSDKKNSKKTLLDRMDIYTQDTLWEALVDHKDVIPGKICTKKGIVSRLIDGEFSKTSPIAPGHKLSIKTLVNNISAKEPVAEWLTKAVLTSMRFRSCIHENILQSLGVSFDEGKAYILYPYMVNRSLKDFLVNIEKDISPVQMMDFTRQIGAGMSYLTEARIEHKDLAARNCMIDDNLVIKISDPSFGDDLYQNEYAFDSDRLGYYPLRWIPMESIISGFHDNKSEVWSFGVVMWELFTRGAKPYNDTKDTGVLSLLQTGSRLGKPESMPDDFDELMTSCWNEYSDNRPTFMDITNTLERMMVSNPRPMSVESVGSVYDDPIYGNVSVGIQPTHSTRRL